MSIYFLDVDAQRNAIRTVLRLNGGVLGYCEDVTIPSLTNSAIVVQAKKIVIDTAMLRNFNSRQPVIPRFDLEMTKKGAADVIFNQCQLKSSERTENCPISRFFNIYDAVIEVCP